MSVKWISYVWDKTDYRDGELLTALALADFANDEGNCFPFMQTIASKARLSVRQIQKIIQNFESDGFLQVTRFQGRGKKPEFQLKKVNSATPFKDRKKVNSATLKGELCDIKKVNSATFPIYKDEPSLEPSGKGENAPETDAPAPTENESDNQTGESPYKLPEYSEPSLPRAVEIYLETFPTTALDGDRLKQFCAKMMTVNETVWRKTLDDWKLNGYKSGNVAGMINRYEKDLESQKPTVTKSGWIHEPGKDKARGWMHG